MSDAHPANAAAGRPLQGAERLALTDRALNAAAEGVTIADARLPDRPLIYANEGFARLTGYEAAEVLGRNCRFLQGSGTDPGAVAEIRDAIAAHRECVVELLNYRKDQTPFWNRLSITPVRDAAGAVTHFIGVQSNITASREADLTIRRTKEALERDLGLAASIQRTLLPLPELELPGVRLAHVFHPCADLAGDTVGHVPLSDHRVAIFLVDVSGHGVGASLLSFTLAHVLSPSAESGLLVQGLEAGRRIVSPASVAERLNREFPMDRTRQYFTMVYGVLDQSNGRFEYVMAGHPSPVLLRHGAAPAPLEGGGLPIGMLEHARYESHTTTLAIGDRLYLYTDGVTEALDAAEQEFGFARLTETIARERDRPLRDGIERVANAVRRWSAGPLLDDVTILAVERIAHPELERRARSGTASADG